MGAALQALRRSGGPLLTAVRIGVYALAALAALGVLTMMTVTCVDVILRILGSSLVGAVDIVTVAGAITVAAALPYTTAVKGHVAIEFFFHKLNRTGRIVVDSICRVALIAMFAVVCRECLVYGHKLRRSGEVTMTLEIPTYWVPYVIGVSSAAVSVVILCHLLRPGRELIKP